MVYTISLTGDLGSGKTTVRDIFAARYGAEVFTTGALVRAAGEARGMDINEFSKYMESHPETDREIDGMLAAMDVVGRSIIIDSRLAWHFVRGTFRVFLAVDLHESAKRIFNARREGETGESVAEMEQSIAARRESERARYLALYGVDLERLHNYDLVLDTTSISPERTAELIASAYEARERGERYDRFLLDPKRLISGGSDEGAVTLARDGNSFAVVTGASAVRAAITSGEPLVACDIAE